MPEWLVLVASVDCRLCLSSSRMVLSQQHLRDYLAGKEPGSFQQRRVFAKNARHASWHSFCGRKTLFLR
jgi:hypothetical protein